MKETETQRKVLDYLYISLLALAVSFNSSTTIFWKREPDIDSSVFLYIAQRMFHGEMPYRDSFDHKGPLIYLFNFAAEMISPDYGPWILDFFCMLVFLIFCYLTFRLILKNRLSSLILVTAAATFIPAYYYTGNKVETVAMPFIALAVYVFCKYFINNSIKNYELILFGMSFASVMMLRANMAAPWCVMCIAVVIHEIMQKKAAAILRYFLLFIAGASIVIIPVFIWLIAGRAFNDFIEQYIVFNMKYSKVVGNEFQEYPVHEVFISFLLKPQIISALIFSVYLIVRKKNLFAYSLTLMIILSTLASSISGRNYAHYIAALIPLSIPAIASGIEELNGQLKTKNWKQFIVPVVVFILSGVVPLSLYINKNGFDTTSGMDIDMIRTLEYIEQYTDEDDPIAIYGNRDSILYLSKRKSVSKYSYQSPIASFDPSILDSYFNDIETEKPKLVIISGTRWGLEMTDIAEHVKKFEYEKLPSPGGTIVVIRILS